MYEKQTKTVKCYVLPEAVYRQTVWAIKDLPRLKKKLKEKEESISFIRTIDTSRISSINHSSVCDTTARVATDIVELEAKINAIESGFKELPEKYAKGIRDKLVFDVPYEDKYHLNTWKKWQQIVVYIIAENLKIL